MVDHLHYDLVRDGRYVCAGESEVYNVDRVARGGGDDLRGGVLDSEHIGYLLDELHARPAYVVNSADERRNVRCARVGGEKRLTG